MLNKQQTAAYRLIQADMRYLMTVYLNKASLGGNYFVAMMPYFAMLVDGAEDWISAVNRAHPNTIAAPTFSVSQQEFYETARKIIKLWEQPYEEIYNQLKAKYCEADLFFSSRCKPVAKLLHLYDTYGVYSADHHFCNNTVLSALFLPDFQLDKIDYGPMLQSQSMIAGQYAVVFQALSPYQTNAKIQFCDQDYDGFIKSPVGRSFSNRFVLMSLLCQINFVLYCVDQYIVDETPTKLRLSYILYYYLCEALPRLEREGMVHFDFDNQYYSRDFRNAMAHYKVGRFLREDEMIMNDPMYGMTQKAFGLDYRTVKIMIYKSLYSLSKQLETYLNLKMS